jgi:hypothetical protein
MTYHSDIKITVKTQPNGYEMNIGNESFFYHKIDDLVAGFIVRVGLHCKDAMEVDDLHLIVLALAAKPNVKTLLADGRRIEDEKSNEEKPKEKKTRNKIPSVLPSHPSVLPLSNDRLADRLRIPLKNIPMGKRITTIFVNAVSAYRGKKVKIEDLTLADVARLSRDEVVNAKGCGGATYYELVKLMSIYHISFGMDVDTIMESDV